MNIHKLLRPLLFSLDAETAHHLVFDSAAIAQRVPGYTLALKSMFGFHSPLLTTHVFGKEFSSPVGVAAGLDKNAIALDTLEAVGFGFVEVGSITARATTGNPKPRLFRVIKDEAIINRMGLNNHGPEVIAKRIQSRKSRSLIVGANIAKTNDLKLVGAAALEDFVAGATAMAGKADYLVLNVSCPNTEDGRTFEEPKSFEELVTRVRPIVTEPLLIKFSPDTSSEVLAELVQICEQRNIDGYLACNTTNSRAGLLTDRQLIEQIGRGGLSGPPLRERMLQRVREIYQLTNGRKPIIAVGGIDSAETAYRAIRAGASLVESYTGLVYRGPALANEIKRGLAKICAHENLGNISEAKGRDV